MLNFFGVPCTLAVPAQYAHWGGSDFKAEATISLGFGLERFVESVPGNSDFRLPPHFVSVCTVACS